MKLKMLSVVIKKLVWVASSSIVFRRVVAACFQSITCHQLTYAPTFCIVKNFYSCDSAVAATPIWLRPNSLFLLAHIVANGYICEVGLSPLKAWQVKIN